MYLYSCKRTPMNRLAKLWFPLACAVNALVAFLWLSLFGRHHSFHIAGVYFSAGILAAAGMLAADGLMFVLLRLIFWSARRNKQGSR